MDEWQDYDGKNKEEERVRKSGAARGNYYYDYGLYNLLFQQRDQQKRGKNLLFNLFSRNEPVPNRKRQEKSHCCCRCGCALFKCGQSRRRRRNLLNTQKTRTNSAAAPPPKSRFNISPCQKHNLASPLSSSTPGNGLTSAATYLIHSCCSLSTQLVRRPQPRKQTSRRHLRRRRPSLPPPPPPLPQHRLQSSSLG